MAGVNDLIADLSIRHQVGVQRLGSSVVKRLMPILDRADADIAKKIMLSDRALDNSFGTKRLQALLEALRDIRHNAQIDFNKGLLAELRKLATYESAFQIGLLAKALPVVMDIVSPTSQMLTAAVTARPFQGALLRDWLTGMEATAVRRVKEAITQGVIQGETIQDMVRRIRGSRALNYRDGVMTTSRRGAETMVRTAVSHVTSAARDILYEENRDIIAKEQWVATLDTRTCPQCQGLDGKTFEVGKGVRTPAHLSCRCVRIPVLKSWREMGFDIDELEPGTRASMDGQVPASMNYNDWLKKQSSAVQDEALGPTRGAMFRRGGMTVDSFTNRAGDELTLDELKKFDGLASAPVKRMDTFEEFETSYKSDTELKAWRSGWNESERDAVREYIDSPQINNYLRAGQMYESYRPQLAGLDSLIASAPKFKEDTVLHRTMNKGVLMVGDEFTDNAFVSTSQASFSQNIWRRLRDPDDIEKIEFIVPAGTPRALIERFPEESDLNMTEILLPRGMRFVVESQKADGTLIVRML